MDTFFEIAKNVVGMIVMLSIFSFIYSKYQASKKKEQEQNKEDTQ